jgi:hypothetical protein
MLSAYGVDCFGNVLEDEIEVEFVLFLTLSREEEVDG